MTRRSFAGLAALAVSVLPAVAHAHASGAQDAGFLHGFAHPLGGWDHLLAMVAVGLWAAQRGGAALWALPAAFVAAMAGGGLLGMAGVALPGVEAVIAGSVILLGGLVALRSRLPLPAAAGAVALAALFHGHAHGAEMPAAASPLLYGLGFALATALLHGVGVLGAGTLRRSGAGGLALRGVGALVGLGGVALAALG